MPSDELQASWRRTEAHLREALAQQNFPDDVRRLAVDFIDHNELGVAFECIVSSLVENDTPLAPLTRESLAAAAREMGLEGKEDWDELTA